MWPAISIAARIARLLWKNRRELRSLSNKFDRKRVAEGAADVVTFEGKKRKARRDWLAQR